MLITFMLLIAAAIMSSIVLLQLRNVLMIAFPALVVRRLPANISPPTATSDLYEKADAELAALGFAAPQWVVIAPERKTPGNFATIAAVFGHREERAMAVLRPPMNITTPNELITSFTSCLADGREPTSMVYNVGAEAIADDKHPAQTIAAATLPEQWAQHQRWVESFQTPLATDFGSQESLLENLQKTTCGDTMRLLNAGKLWRDAQGFARPTLAFAFRILWLSWTRQKQESSKTDIPLARQIMFAAFNGHWQKRTLPARWQWLLLTVSSILFAVLGAMLWDPVFALIILGIIILHEGGHYLAMRALGYRRVQMLALPLLGGVTFGAAQTLNATRHAWIAMMGPLPGIVLGWVLIFFIISNFDASDVSSTLMTAALALLFTNYLNLVPIPPLDGSHIAQAIVPSHWRITLTVFFTIICIAGIAIAVWSGMWLLAVLPMWQLRLIPTRLASDRATRLLAGDVSFSNASHSQQQRLALKTLQQCAGTATNMQQRLQQTWAVVTALTQTTMNWKHRVALAAFLAVLYLLLYLLPFSLMGLAAIFKAPEDLFSPPRAKSEQQTQTQQQLSLSLNDLTVDQLLAQMPNPRRPPAQTDARWLAYVKKITTPLIPKPADPEQVDAAQNRLGWIFPDDYRELLSLHDGYPPLLLLPVTRVQRLAETGFFADEDLQEHKRFFSFAHPSSSLEGCNTEDVPEQRIWRKEELQDCAVIGGLTNVSVLGYDLVKTSPTLLWCSGPEFEQARIVSLKESLWAPDFITYLRYKVTQRITARESAASTP